MLVPEEIESTELGLTHLVEQGVGRAHEGAAEEEKEKDEDQGQEAGGEEETETARANEIAAAAGPKWEVSDLEGFGLVPREQSLALLILIRFVIGGGGRGRPRHWIEEDEEYQQEGK